MKILAVDDDEVVLELLYETLLFAGFQEVTTVTSAKQAADIIARESVPFDCFCLDIQMPEIDGIDLCKWIRRQPNYQKTPILMITAMSDRSYIDRAFAAGASDYVTKPFDSLELITRLRMAERLNAESKKATDSIFAVKALRAQMQDKARINLATPVSIEGVDGVIDLLALENYLLQLSRGGKYSMSAVGFKIADAETLHAKCSPTEFIDVLADVAAAISENLKFSGFLMSYAGNGAFVSVVDGVSISLSEPEHLENAIRHTIETMELDLEDGTPLRVQLHMGAPMRLGLSSGSAAVNILYRAIANAEERCKAQFAKWSTGSGLSAFKILRNRVRAS